MTDNGSRTRDPYAARRAAFEASGRAAGVRVRALGWWRTGTFLLLVLVAASGWGGELPRRAAVVASLALLVLFVALVRRQRRTERDRARWADLARINAAAEARVARDWNAAPLPRAEESVRTDWSARDLNVDGPGSLSHLLGTVWTAAGRRLLASRLREPADPGEVALRQEAIRELAPLLDLRQEIEREARHLESADRRVESFLAWTEEEGWLHDRVWLVRASRALPALLLLLGLAHATGLTSLPLWLTLIPVNAAIWIGTTGRAQRDLDALALRVEDIDRFTELLRLCAEPEFESGRLRVLRAELGGDGVDAAARLGRLARFAELVELRRSPMLYIPVQVATLWDLHVLHLLAGWKRSTGARSRRWFEAAGEIEVLGSLAGLAFDNPDWAAPDVSDGAMLWEAEGLAHPLLPASRRVANDVSLGPPGTFLLVTGSNMSGKSTLMRAIGTNILLAQAGGPVCARRMRLPPSLLGTSFVVEDSLGEGVSYFLAELKRIKHIVEEAERTAGRPDGGLRFLFLLDEILKGTNSHERQIAVRSILLELLDLGAAGAVSTHDLALADIPALARLGRTVHLREHLRPGPAGTVMEFDYRVRPGVAPTTNALALLEMVGIGRHRLAEGPEGPGTALSGRGSA